MHDYMFVCMPCVCARLCVCVCVCACAFVCVQEAVSLLSGRGCVSLGGCVTLARATLLLSDLRGSGGQALLLLTQRLLLQQVSTHTHTHTRTHLTHTHTHTLKKHLCSDPDNCPLQKHSQTCTPVHSS